MLFPLYILVSFNRVSPIWHRWLFRMRLFPDIFGFPSSLPLRAFGNLSSQLIVNIIFPSENCNKDRIVTFIFNLCANNKNYSVVTEEGEEIFPIRINAHAHTRGAIGHLVQVRKWMARMWLSGSEVIMKYDFNYRHFSIELDDRWRWAWYRMRLLILNQNPFRTTWSPLAALSAFFGWIIDDVHQRIFCVDSKRSQSR